MLFPPKISIKKVGLTRVKCVVCGRFESQDADRPALCQPCGSDLPAARGFVVNLVLRTEMQLDRALDTWHDAITNAPEDLQIRFAAFQEGQAEAPAKARQIEEQARTGAQNPLLTLIRLWLDYQDAGERYSNIQQWALSCEAVLG